MVYLDLKKLKCGTLRDIAFPETVKVTTETIWWLTATATQRSRNILKIMDKRIVNCYKSGKRKAPPSQFCERNAYCLCLYWLIRPNLDLLSYSLSCSLSCALPDAS